MRRKQPETSDRPKRNARNRGFYGKYNKKNETTNNGKDKKQLCADAWTQRTERPDARLALFNGFTLPDSKRK